LQNGFQRHAFTTLGLRDAARQRVLPFSREISVIGHDAKLSFWWSVFHMNLIYPTVLIAMAAAAARFSTPSLL
jgi:hypothetical protein